MAAGIKEVIPEAEIFCFPIADGGEGTAEALAAATDGSWKQVAALDPLGRVIESGYGVLGDGATAVIEMAAASGLTLLSKDERNPLLTSTIGTGVLIKSALDSGFRRFIVGIGGSATNDGGTGMLIALGVRFYNCRGELFSPVGGTLAEISVVDTTDLDPRLMASEIYVACDVDNPLCGPRGASFVFAPQKGADAGAVMQLEHGLLHWGKLMEAKFGGTVLDLPGAGAAGGMGAALKLFMQGELKPGIEIVMTIVGLEDAIADAQLAFTGEGKMDAQTLGGKAPMGVAQMAKKYNVPVIGIAGIVDKGAEASLDQLFYKVYSLTSESISESEAVKNAGLLMQMAAKQSTMDFLSERDGYPEHNISK